MNTDMADRRGTEHVRGGGTPENRHEVVEEEDLDNGSEPEIGETQVDETLAGILPPLGPELQSTEEEFRKGWVLPPRPGNGSPPPHTHPGSVKDNYLRDVCVTSIPVVLNRDKTDLVVKKHGRCLVRNKEIGNLVLKKRRACSDGKI